MQCRNCQAEVIDSSKYCNHCGKEIHSNPREDVPAKKFTRWYETGWVWFWLIVFWPLGAYGLIHRAKREHRKWWWAGVGCLVFIAFFGPKSSNTSSSPEPTRASQSRYNQNMLAANTSYGLTKADLAWHAVNTYGWDCSEVLSLSPQTGDYYIITCSNGINLRVYPRSSQHPKITNMYGSYN